MHVMYMKIMKNPLVPRYLLFCEEGIFSAHGYRDYILYKDNIVNVTYTIISIFLQVNNRKINYFVSISELI